MVGTLFARYFFFFFCSGGWGAHHFTDLTRSFPHRIHSSIKNAAHSADIASIAIESYLTFDSIWFTLSFSPFFYSFIYSLPLLISNSFWFMHATEIVLLVPLFFIFLNRLNWTSCPDDDSEDLHTHTHFRFPFVSSVSSKSWPTGDRLPRSIGLQKKTLR